MLVGIMGGTFDPIHTGHLIAAERARVEAGLDEVWLMPLMCRRISPTRRRPLRSSAGRWFALLRKGILFRPIDIEISKGGVSYSIDTIELLRKEYPTTEFAYIIGADMVQYLPQWHRIDDIVRHIRFIGLARPGYELDMEHMSANIRSRVTIVPMPLVEISSTAIREERGQKRSVRYLVPEVVNSYMEVNQLYEA